MAEIKVEKKKPIWPWIVGILVLLLIILLIFLFSNGNDDDIDDATEDNNIEELEQFESDTISDNTYPDNAVGAYLAHIDDVYDEDYRQGGEQTRESMEKLARAVNEKALDLEESPNEELKEISGTSDTLAKAQEPQTQSGPLPTDSLQMAASTIMDALEDLQEKHYPDRAEDELQELRSILNTIENTNQQETDGEQSEANAISAFFEQAADVFMAMPDDDLSGTMLTRDRAADTSLYSTDPDTIETDQ